MPLYQVQFTAESCLTNEADVLIPHNGTNVKFLFSKREGGDRFLRVQAEIQAQNNREAQAKASTELFPQVLDGLSFATRTPLLLIECELILKDERGSRDRRAIYIGHKKIRNKVPLHPEAVAETAKLLATSESRISQCWYRYAMDRELALDRFVFNWQAFEALAGDTDIPTRCQACGMEIEHCGNKIIHRATSKERAAEIFCVANPESSVNEFKKKVWNTARNRIFHGRRYPEPAYLAEVYAISDSVRKAAEKRIAELSGVNEQRVHHNYEKLYRVFHFVEWKTVDTSQMFASDWPQAELVRRTQIAEVGTIFTGVPPQDVSFFNYESDSPNW